MNNHLSQDDINRTDAFLEHHGILGMKWGVRRYQNKDGSLTKAGRKRYGASESDSAVTKKVKQDLATMTGQDFKNKYHVSNTRYMKRVDKYGDPYKKSPLAKLGKSIEQRTIQNLEDKISSIQKDIDRYTSIENSDKWKVYRDGKAIDFAKALEIDKRKLEAELAREKKQARTKIQHMDDSDFLAHYGILGMRWGFRRPTDSDGIIKKGSKAVPTEQYIRAKELRKKAGGRGAPYLTNQELRDVNERLQLERQFKDLTSKDVSAGRKAANTVLGRVGNKVLDTAVTEGMRMTLSTMGLKPDKK